LIQLTTASELGQNRLVPGQPDDRTLVCFSHLRWNFVFQRPQHLMSRFAEAGG
jgi:UDP-galactopyranose mutase